MPVMEKVYHGRVQSVQSMLSAEREQGLCLDGVSSQ